MQDAVRLPDQPDHALPDDVLVDLSRQGHGDAFGELVRRHYRRCMELATLFVRNHWDAEDQVQIACAKAHSRLHQFQGEAEFATWLCRIVTNQCLMFMRERQRAHFIYLDDTSEDRDALPIELPASGPDPECELALGELKHVLTTEMQRVPATLRKVVLLRDIQELSIADVAAELEISVPAAKSRLLRGRIELRNRLKRRCQMIDNQCALSRSAGPVNRVLQHRTIRPLLTAAG